MYTIHTIQLYIHISLSICLSLSIYIYICVYIYIYIYIYNTYNTYILYIYVYMYMCVYIYIYIVSHMCIHSMFTCWPACFPACRPLWQLGAARGCSIHTRTAPTLFLLSLCLAARLARLRGCRTNPPECSAGFPGRSGRLGLPGRAACLALLTVPPKGDPTNK